MAKTQKNEYGEEQKVVQTAMIKCPSCGGNLKFDPDAQKLKCEHCGTSVDLSKAEVAEEIDLKAGLTKDDMWNKEETSVFRCDNCGATVVLQTGETAKVCPFCGTSHVQKVEELEGLKPNAVLPFSFGADKASEFSKKWAKKRLFAPRKFKKSLNSENINGVYTPVFTFDSETVSNYVGKVGYRHTRTVGSGKDRRTETWIEWKPIAGTYNLNFDDLLITAGSKIDQKKLDKTSPYDTNSSTKYEQKFLLGFMAYQYDKELSECWDTAKKRMDVTIKKNILDKYHADVVEYIHISTGHYNVTYKYVMLPVYVGNFNYGKKLYNFFVNGTTGKTYGKTPKSPWRILFTVFLSLAIIVGIGALVYFLGVKG